MLGPENHFWALLIIKMTVPGVFPINIQFIKLYKSFKFMQTGLWKVGRYIVWATTFWSKSIMTKHLGQSYSSHSSQWSSIHRRWNRRTVSIISELPKDFDWNIWPCIMMEEPECLWLSQYWRTSSCKTTPVYCWFMIGRGHIPRIL